MASADDTARRARMVGWYDAAQLVGTAQDVLISTAFGRHADHRLMEAMMPSSDGVYDFSEPQDEFWLDYVADTGDGWNSTYAIAHSLVQPWLRLRQPDGPEHATSAGRVLVLGGDEVYPTPSRDAYKRRLVQPYEAARRRSKAPHPQVFAIPGNHDWYDSLVSFTRLFLAKEWFAGWQAPQSRSYFALKLPHGWWLLGTDMQLGSDIDGPQVDYFRKVASAMGPTDQVILCNAEPHWIYAHIYAKYDAEVYSESNLAFLESDKVLGRRIDVMIAGDQHHYRHHVSGDGRHKITAGGGGAFLHPTHGPDVSELQDGFRLQASFPDPGTSRRLCWRNLAFPILNWRFGILPASLYLLTTWAARVDIGPFGVSRALEVLRLVLFSALSSPTSAIWGALLLVGFFVFTDTHSRIYRFAAGTIHGLAHVTAVTLIGWGASYATHAMGYSYQNDFRQLLLSGLMVFVGGWIVGSFLLGLYLLISLNVFKRHTNEAFSSLAIQDWKNFLRLKVTEQGLTIYPVGLRRVPRRWKRGAAGDGPQFVPDDERASAPELIEEPIVVPRRKPAPPPPPAARARP
jgi:hypothetical protein